MKRIVVNMRVGQPGSKSTTKDSIQKFLALMKQQEQQHTHLPSTPFTPFISSSALPAPASERNGTMVAGTKEDDDIERKKRFIYHISGSWKRAERVRSAIDLHGNLPLSSIAHHGHATTDHMADSVGHIHSIQSYCNDLFYQQEQKARINRAGMKEESNTLRTVRIERSWKRLESIARRRFDDIFLPSSEMSIWRKPATPYSHINDLLR